MREGRREAAFETWFKLETFPTVEPAPIAVQASRAALDVEIRGPRTLEAFLTRSRLGRRVQGIERRVSRPLHPSPDALGVNRRVEYRDQARGHLRF